MSILHTLVKASFCFLLVYSYFAWLINGYLLVWSFICLVVAGGLVRAGEANYVAMRESHHVYAVLVGLFSSITGGISYCLIKRGAKASDQPV